MVRKRSLSSVFDENPTTTRITVRQIAQPRKTRKVPCHCSKCEGTLVHPRTKSKHELLEEISVLGVSKGLENSEPQENIDPGSSEGLENSEPQENVNPGSSQLYTLNEQGINEIQQDHSSRKR